MTIEKEISGDHAQLRLGGWMDTENAPQLAAALDELGAEIKSLTLDLSGLEYTSSAGIRQLVATHKRMGGARTRGYPESCKPGTLRFQPGEYVRDRFRADAPS